MSAPDADPFEFVDRMLGEQQMAHFEMAGMVGEYREMLSDLQDRRNEDAINLMRNLPGAKYYVKTEYVRQTWLKLEGELKRMFPKDQ
jgi:hypothetical protein